MAKEKDPLRDESYFLWKNDNLTLREIAEKLGISEKKIATWKYRDNWENNRISKRSTTQKISSKKCSMVEKKIDEVAILKIVDSELTEMQKRFCIYYIQSFNATSSAIKAGYSKESAYKIGSENLKKTPIKNFLRELKESYVRDDYLECRRILERHARIAFSDMRDFINEKGYMRNIQDVDGTLIKKYKIKDTEYGKEISFELEDRHKSLEFLTKFYGIDPKTELERRLVVGVNDDDKVTEALKVLEDKLGSDF